MSNLDAYIFIDNDINTKIVSKSLLFNTTKKNKPTYLKTSWLALSKIYSNINCALLDEEA